MHYLGKMKIHKIAQMFRFTICELANHEVKMKIKLHISIWNNFKKFMAITLLVDWNVFINETIGFKRAWSNWLQLGMDGEFILANKLKLIRGCLCYDPNKSIALAPSGYQKFQFWAPLRIVLWEVWDPTSTIEVTWTSPFDFLSDFFFIFGLSLVWTI